MELEKLKERSEEGGVKELWRREVSPEVQTAFEKMQEILGKGKTDALRPS